PARTRRKPRDPDAPPVDGEYGRFVAVRRWMATRVVGRLQRRVPGSRAMVLPHHGELGAAAGASGLAGARDPRAAPPAHKSSSVPDSDGANGWLARAHPAIVGD